MIPVLPVPLPLRTPGLRHGTRRPGAVQLLPGHGAPGRRGRAVRQAGAFCSAICPRPQGPCGIACQGLTCQADGASHAPQRNMPDIAGPGHLKGTCQIQAVQARAVRARALQLAAACRPFPARLRWMAHHMRGRCVGTHDMVRRIRRGRDTACDRRPALGHQGPRHVRPGHDRPRGPVLLQRAAGQWGNGAYECGPARLATVHVIPGAGRRLPASGCMQAPGRATSTARGTPLPARQPRLPCTHRTCGPCSGWRARGLMHLSRPPTSPRGPRGGLSRTAGRGRWCAT